MTMIENVQSIKQVEVLLERSKDAEHRDTREALNYAKQALDLSKSHHLKRQIIQSHVLIGRCYWIKGQYDKSIEHSNIALDMTNDFEDDYSKAEALIALGNVHIMIEMYDQTLTYYNQALVLCKERGFDILISKLLNNFGAMHEEMGSNEIALKYYMQSLEKSKEIEDHYGTANAQLNMGNMFAMLHRFDEAYTYLSKVEKYALQNNKRSIQAYVNYTYGVIHQLKNEYKDSIEHFTEAINIAQESKDLFILLKIYLEMAKSNENVSNIEAAEKYYLNAIATAEAMEAQESKLKAYSNTAEFYHNKKDDVNALYFYQAFNESYKDLLEKRREERIKIIEFQVKLSASKKETKQYQELSNRLEKSYKSMQVLSEIGQALTSTHKIEEIFGDLYENMNKLMRVENMSVALYDADENALRFDHNIEHGVELEPHLLSLDNEKSFAVYSYLHNEVILMNDVKQEFGRYIKGVNAMSGDIMYSTVFVPLEVEGDTIGVVTVQAKDKNTYTENDKVLLQTLASYLAIALRNANKTKQLDKLNQLLKKKSEHDGLTGIPNRRLFDETYQRLWVEAMEHERQIGVMIIDIDNFKTFNDKYGHLVGDEVVKSVANILEENLRDNAFASRYGGDEFTVILPNTTPKKAMQYDKRVRTALVNVNKALGIKSLVTISAGIAIITPASVEQKEKLIYHADNQLYESKAKGKNTTSILIK